MSSRSRTVLAELLWAEKYRPKSLSEIVNQEEIVNRLMRFVKEKNMPHLLFAGPPGTGKTTAAHALAHDLYGKDYRMYMLELNASVAKDTPVLVRIKGEVIWTTFEELDKLYFSRGNVLRYGDGEYVKVDDLEVLSIDKASGRVRWFRVSWLIRHKAKYVVRVILRGGGEIKLTGNHSVMMINEYGELTERKASDIRPGDYLISFATTPGNGRGIKLGSSVLGDLGGVKNTEIRTYSLATNAVGINEGCGVPRLGSGFMYVDTPWLGSISDVRGFVGGYGVKLVMSRDAGFSNHDSLPAKPFIRFLERVSGAVGIDWRKLLSHHLRSDVGTIPKRYVLEVLESVDISKLSSEEYEVYRRLLTLAKSDVHVVEIAGTEVIEYDDYVYDVSVPDNNMFFAGAVPVLLHNSDERGIDVIRTKVKEFARSKLPANIPFKIVLLDEADNMTADAQQALRRLMEMYVDVTRFILIANYPSKIIEPIQSRCAVFRFTPLKKEDVVSRLKWICEQEGVDYDLEALEVIYDISEGDMRKAINILQASAALGKVTVANVYKVVGLAHPREVREMIKVALSGDFMRARDIMRKLMLSYGLSGTDLIKQIHKEIFSPEIDLPEHVRVEIADYVGEIQFRLVEGADDEIQLNALLAKLALMGKSLRTSATGGVSRRRSVKV